MKNHVRSICLIGGLAAFFAGVVLMILGQMWGLAVLFLGICLIAANFAMMMRTGGYRAEGTFFNGLAGQGRQQSEVAKADQPVVGEQNAQIWDELKK